MILRFMHNGYDIATSAWSITETHGNVVLCYTWSALNGFGILPSATGVAKKEFSFSLDQFWRLTRSSGAEAVGGISVLDLRRFG